MVLASNHKNLLSPAERRTPVNISMPLRVLDRVDELSFTWYGTQSGKRSETVVKILKEYLKIK